MTTKTGTESDRISDRDAIESALRPPRPTFEDAFRYENRTRLEIAAQGLTPTGIATALMTAGLDPARGLEGVPKSREQHVLLLLTVAVRGG